MALVRVFDPLSQVSQIITSLQNCPQSQLPQSDSVSEKTSQSKAQDHNLHHLDYLPQPIFEPNSCNQSTISAQTPFHCVLCSTLFAPDKEEKPRLSILCNFLNPWCQCLALQIRPQQPRTPLLQRCTPEQRKEA